MPEVTVRKRVGRRSGGIRYRFRRWLYYRRATLAVGVAALLAVAAALASWTVLSGAAVDAEASQASPAAP